MCRFLLAKSKKPIKPQAILEKFAKMSQNTPAYDGDWQGDGWGISYLDKVGKWQVHKSLKPVWKDQDVFPEFPESNIFAIHARSSSFEHHEGKIEYNQPYIEGDIAFVFNGLLKKVKFKQKIPGEIGSQKLFYLIKKLLRKQKNPGGMGGRDPDSAQWMQYDKTGIANKSQTHSGTNHTNNLTDPEHWREGNPGQNLDSLHTLNEFAQLIQKNVDDIQGCNVGLADQHNISALNLFNKYPDYYKLHYLDTPELKIICSNDLEGMRLSPFTSKTIIL